MNYKVFEKLFVGFIIFLIVTRLLVDLFVPFDYENRQIIFQKPTLHKDYGILTPVDDPEIIETSIYYLRGLGYVSSISFNRPSYRNIPLFKTAFRPKFSVYLHIAGIYIYSKLNPEFDLNNTLKMPQNYFYFYGIFLLFFKWIFFIPSVICLFRIIRKLTSEVIAYGFTLIFVVYPSTIYVGLLNVFEPITTYMMVIFLHKICFDYWDNKQNSLVTILKYSVLVLFCMYLKPHVLLTIILLFLPAFVFSIIEKRILPGLKLISFSILLIILGHLPILKSNYDDFGKIFLANQAGIDFFHGHNPYAKGSWTSSLFVEHGDQLIPWIKQNKNLPILDEKQEADYYQKLGIEWIVQNPMAELILATKKVAIFFLPFNFMSLKFNLITFIIHLFLGVYLFYFINNKRYSNLIDWYILGIIFAILALNVLYFVEYRWRFFADPEIIILSSIGLYRLANYVLTRTKRSLNFN